MKHLQVIGKISDVKIDSRNTFITFVTNENILVGTNVKFEMDVDAVHKSNQSFEVTEVQLTEDIKLKCTAKEVGYWAKALNRRPNLDIRNLIGIDVKVVTDEKAIAGIRESSCWC